MDKKHYSPFEFGTIYLTIPFWCNPQRTNLPIANFYDKNPYSCLTCELQSPSKNYLVTTNLRVIIENDR